MEIFIGSVGTDVGDHDHEERILEESPLMNINYRATFRLVRHDPSMEFRRRLVIESLPALMAPVQVLEPGEYTLVLFAEFSWGP